jgi:hypothetical protein
LFAASERGLVISATSPPFLWRGSTGGRDTDGAGLAATLETHLARADYPACAAGEDASFPFGMDYRVDSVMFTLRAKPHVQHRGVRWWASPGVDVALSTSTYRDREIRSVFSTDSDVEVGVHLAAGVDVRVHLGRSIDLVLSASAAGGAPALDETVSGMPLQNGPLHIENVAFAVPGWRWFVGVGLGPRFARKGRDDAA